MTFIHTEFFGFFFWFFWILFGFVWLKSDTTNPERAQRADQHVYASAEKQGNLLNREVKKKVEKSRKISKKIEKNRKNHKKTLEIFSGKARIKNKNEKGGKKEKIQKNGQNLVFLGF